jgi:hypothetical protein
VFNIRSGTTCSETIYTVCRPSQCLLIEFPYHQPPDMTQCIRTNSTPRIDYPPGHPHVRKRFRRRDPPQFHCRLEALIGKCMLALLNHVLKLHASPVMWVYIACTLTTYSDGLSLDPDTALDGHRCSHAREYLMVCCADKLTSTSPSRPELQRISSFVN